MRHITSLKSAASMEYHQRILLSDDRNCVQKTESRHQAELAHFQTKQSIRRNASDLESPSVIFYNLVRCNDSFLPTSDLPSDASLLQEPTAIALISKSNLRPSLTHADKCISNLACHPPGPS